MEQNASLLVEMSAEAIIHHKRLDAEGNEKEGWQPAANDDGWISEYTGSVEGKRQFKEDFRLQDVFLLGFRAGVFFTIISSLRKLHQ